MPIRNFNFPRVTVNQEFNGIETLAEAVLPVCVIGPQYNVRTYDKYKEALRVTGTGPTFSYPGKVGVVDQTTVQLLYKDAAAILFTAADHPAAPGHFERVTRNNQVIADAIQCVNANEAVCFATGGGIPRTSTVKTDIVPGDKIRLQYVSGESTVQYVSGDSTVSIIATILDVTAGENGGYSILRVDHDIPQVETLSGTITRVMDVRINSSCPGFVAGADSCTEPDDLTITLLTTDGPAQAVQVDTTGNLSGVSCAIYIEYSERMNMYDNTTGVIASGDGYREACLEVFGDCSARNPLGLAVKLACSTARGQFVYFMSVPQDTPAAYRNVIDFLGKSDAVYSLVICSQDKAIIESCKNQIDYQAALDIPFYRILWYGISNPQAVPLLTAKASEYVYDVSGTKPAITLSTTLLAAAGLGDTSSLKEGDSIVLPAGTNAFGAPVYTSYVIDTITTNTNTSANTSTVTFDCDTPPLLGSDAEISIVRTNGYTRTQLRNYIIHSKYVSDRRVTMVYADNAVLDGQRIPNYALAAAAAGMRSYQEPHRPLSNLPYTGTFSVEETNGFTDSDLRILGSNGIWLIGNNAQGIPINRKQMTTAASNDINKDQQSLTTNIDSICRELKRLGRDFVGNSNISPALLTILQADCANLMESYLISYKSAFVGPQLLSYEVASVWQDPIIKDRVYARISGEPPKPFNEFDITFALV